MTAFGKWKSTAITRLSETLSAFCLYRRYISPVHLYFVAWHPFCSWACSIPLKKIALNMHKMQYSLYAIVFKVAIMLYFSPPPFPKCALFSIASYCLMGHVVKWIRHWIKVQRSGVWFPLLVLCRSVRQIYQSMLPLSTRQKWLPSELKKCQLAWWSALAAKNMFWVLLTGDETANTNECVSKLGVQLNTPLNWQGYLHYRHVHFTFSP